MKAPVAMHVPASVIAHAVDACWGGLARGEPKEGELRARGERDRREETIGEGEWREQTEGGGLACGIWFVKYSPPVETCWRAQMVKPDR